MNIEQFHRVLRKAMLLPVFALIGMAAALYWQMNEADSTVALIERADQRIAEAMQLNQYVLDEETALRGYEITHDPSFVAAFSESRMQIEAYFNQLQASQGTTDRAERLQRARDAYTAWDRGFAGRRVASIQSGSQTSNAGRHSEAEHQLQLVKTALLQLRQAPEEQRVKRIQLWQEQVRRTWIVLGILALSIGLAIGLYMRSQLRQVSAAFRESLRAQREWADEIFRSEQHLRTTLESIGDGVITCDAEGAIQTMNKVAQELTGWSEAEAKTLQLERVFDSVNETSREPMENPVVKVKRLGRVVGLTNHTILRRRDGTELIIDDSGAPIRDQHGALTGVVLVFRDITMQRKSQEALIANEKLAVAGRLAASIAHEIHNPLDSVANLLFLMGGQSTPEESEQFLQLAKQELGRVTQISRAMLGLYRESKEPVDLDLKALIESLLMLMDRRMHDLGVTIAADLPDAAVVRGFPAELRQVFTNLISNAAEAAGPGGTVRINAYVRPSGGTFNGSRLAPGVTVVISDDGPGIPEDVRKHLFEPFFTTKGENGTGLGLWVSRGIMTKHGGSIAMDSDTSPERHGTQTSVFLAFNPVISANHH